MSTGRACGVGRKGRLLVLLLLGCLCAPLLAAPLRVQIHAAPAAAIEALRQARPDMDWRRADAAGDADIALVWQVSAYADAVRQSPRLPILLLAQTAQQPLRAQDARLLWGAPLQRQVQLAQRVLPGVQRIGVLWRSGLQAEIEQLQRQPGMPMLVSHRVEGMVSARDVSALAERSEILIASNDDALFNADTAKLILLTAYRHQRAWIGPTPSFVHAGALATMAVAKPALIQAIIERLAAWQRTGRLGPDQQLPVDELIGNVQVARSLGLQLPTPAQEVP